MWFVKKNKDNTPKLLEINAGEARSLVTSYRDQIDKDEIEYHNLVSRILNSPYLDKSFSAIINKIMWRILTEATFGKEIVNISYETISKYIDDESPIYKYKGYLDDCRAGIVDSYAYIIKEYLSKSLGFKVIYDTYDMNYEDDRILNISWKEKD